MNNANLERERQAFEHWITLPPFERNTARFPSDQTRYPWPNGYCDYEVQIAWEAWQEARKEREQK